MDIISLARLLAVDQMRELGQFFLFVLYAATVVAVAALLAGVAYSLWGGN